MAAGDLKAKLIIDTDAGVDDALAILCAIRHFSKVEIVAITCTHGNVPLDKVCRNVLRVLQHFNQTQIPVYVGCDHPLVADLFNDKPFHGEDGLGNVTYTHEKNLVPQLEHASVALINYVNKFHGEITLVALGPLTNLAVAQRLDNKFSSKLKNLVFMGGNIRGIGNVTSSAEFNFYADPEAAYVVLQEFTCPIQCVPWEPCYDRRLSIHDYNKLISGESKESKFAKSITEFAVKWINSSEAKSNGYFPCDLYTMVFVLFPAVALRVENWPISVELRGDHTRGEMIIETRSTKTRPTVEIVMDFDYKFLMKIFENIFIQA